jgi:hypothetical protein
MRARLFVSLILLCNTFFCTSQKELTEAVYRMKGFNGMLEQLLPEVIDAGIVFTDVKTIEKSDQFACIKNADEFGHGFIDDKLEFSYKPAVKGFPGDAVGDLDADETGTIMWGKYGYCGFLAVDQETKNTLSMVPHIDDVHHEEVIFAYKIDLPGDFLLLQLCGDKNCYMIYDLAKKKSIFISDSIRADFHKIEKTTYLLGNPNHGAVKWCIADLNLDGLRNIRTNELTVTLTNKKVNTGITSINFKRRIIIGSIQGPNSSESWVLVKWNPDFKDVTVQPLIYQCPAEYIFDDKFQFSSDGEWLVNTAVSSAPDTSTETSGFPGTPQHAPKQLVFYHINPNYPQGISPPVFAGNYIGSEGKMFSIDGCFVKHSTLGTIFLELSGGNVVLVYKMSDMLPIIAKKLASLAR